LPDAIRKGEEARELDVRYLSVKPVARNLEAIVFYVEKARKPHCLWWG
jgi:hypothetical protein